MTAYLLDTNHASSLVTLRHHLRQRYFATAQAGDEFAICIPVLAEVLFGLGLLPRAEANRQEWQQLRQQINCYQVEEIDANQAAELQILLRRKGWKLDTIDAMIAAIALRYDLILLTSDKDFSAIPNLKTENWR